MAPERPPERDREVIVTDTGDRSGASGALVALVAIVAIVLIGWLLLNVLGTDSDDGPTVNIPTEFDVDVDDGGDTGDTDDGDTGDTDTDG